MASVNASQADFEAVAAAANDADMQGDKEQALALDKLARKINAALSSREASKACGGWPSAKRSPFTWQDVPSTLLSTMREES
ncbi:MAG: hypothetical protein MI753_04460 [Hyphomicrobiales bacterium]|nr:hypothetical protein [Hyphomicrobiales bacterium]